uniref:C2 domain-containing protein n=1 Tax=Eutreptiella gymnastica TaxID=73025 RepID=A0A7S1IRR5_9EUGL
MSDMFDGWLLQADDARDGGSVDNDSDMEVVEAEVNVVQPEERRPCRIVVTLVKARELANLDEDGDSDPYVKVTFGQTTRCTRHRVNTANPTWNEPLTFDIAPEPTVLPKVLQLTVMDRDFSSNDEVIGQADIKLSAGRGSTLHEYRLRGPGMTHRAVGYITVKIFPQYKEPAELTPLVPPKPETPPLTQAAVAILKTPKRPPQKRALLIGINYQYFHATLRPNHPHPATDPPIPLLGGCVNDAKNTRAFLCQHFGFEDSGILMLLDDESTLANEKSKAPTTDNIRRGIRWLLCDAQPGDLLYFHFSGHGSQVATTDSDEEDMMNECLIPLDMNWKDKIIYDDEIHADLIARVPDGVTLTAVFDCCHSGTMSDLAVTRDLRPPTADVGSQSDLEEPKSRWCPPPEDHVTHSVMARAAASCTEPAPATRALGGPPRQNVVTFSAAQDHQTAADAALPGPSGKKEKQGAMSWALQESLKNNRYKITNAQLLSSMRAMIRRLGKQYTQIPGMATTDSSFFAQGFCAAVA